MLKIKNGLKNLKFLLKIFNAENIIFAIVLYLMLALVISPAYYIKSAEEGILLWVNNLLPSLFPFLVLTKILIDLDILEKATKKLTPVMKKLFKTGSNSGYLFLISIISGYPIGSKITADAFKQGKISYTEMHRIITFTSVSGPLFIIGTVGTNMLANSKIGYIILLSHIISAILNGVLYRNYKPNKMYLVDKQENMKNNKNILTSAIKNSIESILIVGGIVCIFYVAMDSINSIITLPHFMQGIIEMTKGCYEVSISKISIELKTILCTALITFGGFCIHSQAMSFLKDCKISYKFFLIQKTTQTIFSILVSTILILIFN